MFHLRFGLQRRGRYKGSPPRFAGKQPFPLHVRKHLRHRVPVDPQKAGQLPHGGQLGAGGQLPRLNQIDQLSLELGVDGELIFSVEPEIHLYCPNDIGQ